ncbi:MAG: transcription antitermination factor NusB [Acidimicrobiales bacterium]|nr:transcription antitermination factor NusB [Acidimicrobiales bacterium]
MADDPRRVAIDAIVRIDDGGAYANVLLPKLLEETDLEPRDRGFVTELVYGSTRRRRALDHVVDRFLVQDPPPAARAALRIGAHQLIEMGTPPHAAVSATVSAAPKRFRGMVNAVLRKVATAAESGIEYPSPAVELSYPDWVVDRLRTDIGADEATAALTTMNRPATVQRRDDGYVQDESSQRIAALVPSAPGDRVLDLCAAPGGKATGIADRGGFVVAADLRPSRVGLIRENVARLGTDRVAVLQADATAPPFVPETFDAVLVDAPCSGLGALRRRPDARWRISPSDVDELATLQRRMLVAAAPLVRPGGTLVYSVCTLTAAESTDVVGACRDELAALGLTGHRPADADWRPFGPDVDLLLPGPGHDGMCRAVFRRG